MEDIEKRMCATDTCQDDIEPLIIRFGHHHQSGGDHNCSSGDVMMFVSPSSSSTNVSQSQDSMSGTEELTYLTLGLCVCVVDLLWTMCTVKKEQVL